MASEINTAHGCPWATVRTVDGAIEVEVSLRHLHFDEEGGVYLLVWDKTAVRERRLYVDNL